MSEENKKPKEHDDDQPEVEEVVTEFGDIRVKSGFEIEEQEPGVLGISLFSPTFLFDDDDDLEGEDLEDGENNHDGHKEAEE